MSHCHGPKQVEVLLDGQRPQHRIGNGDSKERRQVGKVQQAKSNELERCPGNEKYEQSNKIGGKDSQGATDIEFAVVIGPASRLKQQSRDQESGKHKKQVNAELAHMYRFEQALFERRKL